MLPFPSQWRLRTRWTYFVWRRYRSRWRCPPRCYRSRRWRMTHRLSPIRMEQAQGADLGLRQSQIVRQMERSCRATSAPLQLSPAERHCGTFDMKAVTSVLARVAVSLCFGSEWACRRATVWEMSSGSDPSHGSMHAWRATLFNSPSEANRELAGRNDGFKWPNCFFFFKQGCKLCSNSKIKK